MKKLILLCIVVLAFSCSSDDDAASYSSSDLVGTWVETSFTFNGEEEVEQGECKSEVVFTDKTSVYIEKYGDDCEKSDVHDA